MEILFENIIFNIDFPSFINIYYNYYIIIIVIGLSYFSALWLF